MTAKKPEDIIRTYLSAKADPSSLVDSKQVEKLTAELEGTDDPVARIELRTQLANAKQPDLSGLREQFVGALKPWADKLGATADVLRAEGIDDDELREAGFDMTPAKRARRTTQSGSRTTQAAVIASMTGTFSVKDLQDKTGASSATVRNAISSAIEAKKIEDVGVDPNHEGPGRAPTRYKVK